MALKFSTFNCRGLQDGFKRKSVFSFFHKKGDDIIFLQETHASISNETFWSSQWGGHCWFSSHASNSRGVGILIKANHKISVNSVDKDPDGRFLVLDIIINNFHVILVNVYGPNKDDPDFYFNLFSRLDNLDASRLIISGDLNVALGPLDYHGSRLTHSNVNSCKALLSLMEEFNLIDVWRNEHPTLRAYTRHQKTPPALSRLDYILISSNLANNVNDSDIVTGVKSDHSIVKCKISTNNPPKGKGFWKLNCHFLRHDADFVSFIKNKISEFKEFHSDTSCNPHVIWDAFKCTITGHCIQYCCRKKKEGIKNKLDIQTKIDQINSKISKISRDNDHHLTELLNELDSLETQLDKIFDQETAGLIVRSRIKWAEHGEKNSRYFCNLEKRSNDKKNIFILKNNLGSTISNQMDIIRELQSFYQSLYSSSSTPDNTNNITQFLDKLDMPHMSDDSKIQLNRPITKAEILKSLKSLNLNRTPGYDGLPAEFYIVFFNDICDMLLDCFHYSFEKGFMSSTQRTGVITLLPKKDKDPHLIKNHRPISLLNTDYKIIAKVMANRLKGCCMRLFMKIKLVLWREGI